MDRPGGMQSSTSGSDPSEPDPSVLWRWFARASQPVFGWLLVIAGLIAIGVGYYGTSREFWVARQVPYVVSGGLLGLALVFFGGLLLGVGDLRRGAERLTRLEMLVEELHRALLTSADAPGRAAAHTSNGSTERVVALEKGTTYHAPDCAIVADKDDTTTFSLAEAMERGLSPCKLCSPPTTDAGARASTTSA